MRCSHGCSCNTGSSNSPALGIPTTTPCFNIAARTRDGDVQVVRLDHEEVLCHERIAPPTVLSSSFRELVQRAVGTG
jgi:hypothetical protein